MSQRAGVISLSCHKWMGGAVLLIFAAPLWAQWQTASFQGQEVAANEVLVKFKTGAAVAHSLSEAAKGPLRGRWVAPPTSAAV